MPLKRVALNAARQDFQQSFFWEAYIARMYGIFAVTHNPSFYEREDRLPLSILRQAGCPSQTRMMVLHAILNFPNNHVGERLHALYYLLQRASMARGLYKTYQTRIQV
jgi:hypothetical protein